MAKMWVSDLEAPNAWLEVLSYGSNHGQSSARPMSPGGGRVAEVSQFNDVRVIIKPGRFQNALTRRYIRGTAGDVIIQAGPQFQLSLVDAMITSLSWSAEGTSLAVGFNFERSESTYDGTPK